MFLCWLLCVLVFTWWFAGFVFLFLVVVIVALKIRICLTFLEYQLVQSTSLCTHGSQVLENPSHYPPLAVLCSAVPLSSRPVSSVCSGGIRALTLCPFDLSEAILNVLMLLFSLSGERTWQVELLLILYGS